MNIQLNGEPKLLDAPCSVTDLLSGLSLADKRVAVEINGEIVPRSQQASRLLEADDHVEVVVAVGGG
jgi:sulfur carrier protein